MAEHRLSSGQTIKIDDADLDLLEGRSWRVWRSRKGSRAYLVADEQAMGRRFRLLLHRMVAARIEPRLFTAPKRFRIYFSNNDPLDVRRTNIEISHTPRVGRPPRSATPTGSKRCARQRPVVAPPVPPRTLWAGWRNPSRSRKPQR